MITTFSRILCGLALLPVLYAGAKGEGRYGWRQVTNASNPLIQGIAGDWVSAEYAYASMAGNYRQSLKRLSFRPDGSVVWRREDLAGGPAIVMTNEYSWWEQLDQGTVLYLAATNHAGPWSEVATVLLRHASLQTNWLLVGDVLTGMPDEMFPVPAFFVREKKAQFLAEPHAADRKGADGSNGSPRPVSWSLVSIAFFCGCLISAAICGALTRKNEAANKALQSDSEGPVDGPSGVPEG
jgi:hypothetical protein